MEKGEATQQKRPRKRLRDCMRAIKYREKKNYAPLPNEVLVNRTIEASTAKGRLGKIEESTHWNPEFDGAIFDFRVTQNKPYNFLKPNRKFQFKNCTIDSCKFNVRRHSRKLSLQ